MLVGFSTSDDAGVYKISDDLALVQTVDFFTPIVDDPFDFGRIAAANALSDIYAMGAKPLTALNIAGFPIEEYGPEILTQILEGGAAIVREAGVALLGGHTIKDDEPKYGLAVTGLVHPRKIVTNAKARVGDALVLTKPLGTGILASALKKGSIDEDQMRTAIASMATLNAAASEAMLATGAHAATDVTGFGLLGHAGEMARASKVRLRLRSSQIPVFELVRDRNRDRSRRNARERTRARSLHGIRAGDRRGHADHTQRRTNVRRPPHCAGAEERRTVAGRAPLKRTRGGEDRRGRVRTRYRGGRLGARI